MPVALSTPREGNQVLGYNKFMFADGGDEKMSKKFLVPAILFILGISLYACGDRDSSSRQEDSQAAVPEKKAERQGNADAIRTVTEDVKEAQEDLIRTEASDSLGLPAADLPEFIGNSFEFGTYSEKVRIANADNMEEIRINGENRMELPECNVLSILLTTICSDVVLYEGNPEEIKGFLEEIQKLTLKKETEAVPFLTLNADLVFEADCIMVNGSGKYMKVSVRSMSDGTHYFDIWQEGRDAVYASAQSDSLLQTARAMAGLKSVDISSLEKIEKLEAWKENNWVTLGEEKKDIFRRIIKDKVEKAKNYSGGCPFDCRLRATLQDGEAVELYYASDDCGFLVAGDSTYQIILAPGEEGDESQFEYRNQMADLFAGQP